MANLKNAADMTWSELLPVLSKATETECSTMLKQEQAGPRRMTHLMRIHSRFNVLRAIRERRELVKQ